MVNISSLRDFTKFALLTIAFTGVLSGGVVLAGQLNVSSHHQVIAVDDHTVCSTAKFERN